jgi:hypothetical protein
VSHSASETTPPLGPIGPPLDDSDAATKKYVDDNAGGGSQPVTREIFVLADPLTVTAGSFAQNLPWTNVDGSPSGDVLLDVTTPGSPTVITAGVYAISAFVMPDEALTLGATYQAELDLDLNGADPSMCHDSAPASAAQPQPCVTISQTFYFPAGAVLAVGINNFDSVDRPFRILRASVQRLS